MTTEHERIEKNTKDISMINRRIDQIQRLLGSDVQAKPVLAAHSTYSFVFGSTPVELGATIATKAVGEWLPLIGCHHFYENTTDEPQTVTITIKNTSNFTMYVDKDGTAVTDLAVGETKTIIVVIPAGSWLHADRDGEYLR